MRNGWFEGWAGSRDNLRRVVGLIAMRQRHGKRAIVMQLKAN